MHVLNLTNIYDMCNSQNCQTVTLNKIKCYATISLPKYKKIYYQRPQWGFDFDHFRGARGAKIRKLFGKKSELSYKLNLIVSKLF